MEGKGLKFNIFFNDNGANLEDLVIEALINFINSKNKGLYKCS